MVFDKVKQIIAEELSIEAEDIKLESKLQEDLGADSLDAVEIIMAIEEEFDIEIDDNEVVKIKTVKNIVDYIEQTK
ncbi:acyl carrier protein [Haloplasma contractile]|uniref:Acyl carrier protein n=1 Tax=Haloplasma contractile SSD-17B TaxID=1033810 RepID=U2FPL0_9MOLU|nr:acyl carrier protein [Haloplasma contractile]ERJ12999.1 Acyl carrier protein [Haloplasma contractile SSD-17B]